MIAIVGRPNVGKSTLLNRLAGRNVAVVEDQPGVTRDRLFVDCRLGDRDVVLVDTGGLDTDPTDKVSKAAVELAHLAVQEVDLVLFVCDGRDGLHPLDHQVSGVLRRSGKPFLCVINKMDPGSNREVYEFSELGLDVLAISATHGTGLDTLSRLVDELLSASGLPNAEAGMPRQLQEARLKMCLLGRPNVGKSSLANQLVGQATQIVSEIAGTTRDAVDIAFEHQGQAIVLVDTPGVRRKVRISERLERFGVVAAFRSLDRADVAVVVLDASLSYADQDARLLRLAHDRGRPLVVAVNKADLWTAGQRDHYLDLLKHGLRFVAYAPVVVLSALTGQGVNQLLPAVLKVHAAAGERVGTGDLNRLFADALERQLPPVIKGRRGKLFFVTQTKVHPPTFVAWVNDPERFPESYRRYLDHRLREHQGFEGTPLRLVFRARKQRRGPRPADPNAERTVLAEPARLRPAKARPSSGKARAKKPGSTKRRGKRR
jgi:GTP-binding protein